MVESRPSGYPIREAVNRLGEIAAAFEGSPAGDMQEVEAARANIVETTNSLSQKLSEMEGLLIPGDILDRERYATVLEAVLNARSSKYTYKAVVIGDPATLSIMAGVLGETTRWVDEHYDHFTGGTPLPPRAPAPPGHIEHIKEITTTILDNATNIEQALRVQEDSANDPCVSVYRHWWETTRGDMEWFVDYPFEDLEACLAITRGYVRHLKKLILLVPLPGEEIATCVEALEKELDGPFATTS